VLDILYRKLMEKEAEQDTFDHQQQVLSEEQEL
jgi:hypothetical protein